MKIDEKIFQVIRKNFQEDSKISMDDIEVFDFVTCTGEYNASWNMVLQPDFLRGYTEYTNSGQTAMGILHDRNTYISLGRTVQGYSYLTGDKSVAKVYMIKDINIGNGITSNDIIKSLNFGTLFDTSIEFRPGKVLCSICGLDLYSWESGCRHYPGCEYEGQSCHGKAYHDGTVYSTFHIVLDGSLPGAGIIVPDKVASFGVGMGDSVHYGKIDFNIKDNKLKKKQEATISMDGESNKAILDALNELKSVNTKLQESISNSLELSSLVEKSKTEMQEMENKICELEANNQVLSKFKDSYLDMLAEYGVKAYGNDFDKAMFTGKSIDSLQEMRLKFIELATKNRNAGMTQNTDTTEMPEDTEIYKVK